MNFKKSFKNFGIIIFLTSVIFLFFFFIFFGLKTVRAESITPIGWLKDEGRSFKLEKSDYLKITLESSEPIRLFLESVPEMVILHFEPISNHSSTIITLSGFPASTVFHKYEDDYHNHLVFTTDEEGKYTYIQDLSKPHLVFIQPQPSTKFIKDNATGGDCYLIGSWDPATKTCTLTTDVNETIQIDSNGITLDGNGHKIETDRSGHGVYLPYRRNVTIKNLTVKNTVSGIYLYSAHENTVINNTAILNDSSGMFLLSSNNNLIMNNSIQRTYFLGIGIRVMESNHNIIRDNNSSVNSFFGIDLEESFDNVITNNVFHYHSSAGIALERFSNNNTITFNLSSNNEYGIFISYSNNNKVYNNNFINNKKRPSVFGTGNIFNLPLPDGGNYWSDFDTPEEGCYDLNKDEVCDSSYVFSDGRDDLPWIKKDGWIKPQNQPPQISNLGQFKSDGVLQILEGSLTTENTVVFKAIVSDPNDDQVKLQIEIKKFDEEFDETNLLESEFFDSGSEVVLIKNDLSDGQYHWRARAVDDKNGVSDWQEFGEIGNVDFEVKTVPLYTQVRSPYPSDDETKIWAELDYADGKKYSCGSKIRQCGCAITSIVMIARYYDITEAQGKDVNPKEINEWLRDEPGGYQNGNVNWLAAAKYTGWRIQYERTDNTKNNYALLDKYLNKNQPVISKEARGRGGLPYDHFIVIDNKLSSTYGVKDPAWYNTKTLNETTDISRHIRGYENGFDGLRIYKKGNGLAQSGIVITLGSPAELLITDPLGRKVGRDTQGNEYQEIPNAWYFEENYDDPTGEEPPTTDKKKSLYILEPLDGEYELDVIGTGSGPYSLSLSFHDNQGNQLVKEFHSEITSGQIVQYNIFFDSSDSNNSHIEVSRPMKSFNIKKMIIFWGLNCLEFEKKLEEIEDLEKELPILDKKLPQHCFKKKNTFILWGNFELPEGYKKDDLDRSILFNLKFPEEEAKDKIAFKELRNLWLYQEKFHQDDSLEQKMDIKTAIIYWSKDQRKNWFYLRGQLSLDNTNIDTLPRQVEVSLEIPINQNKEIGKIVGKETIEFKRSKYFWFYFTPLIKKFWDIFGFFKGTEIIQRRDLFNF